MTEQTWQEYCNRVRKLEKRVKALEQEPMREFTEEEAKAYSKAVARKAKREREKRNLALSIIGGAFLSLPVLYGMLFIITLV